MRRGLGTGMAANGVPVDTVAHGFGAVKGRKLQNSIYPQICKACAVVLLISTHWEVAYDQSP